MVSSKIRLVQANEKHTHRHHPHGQHDASEESQAIWLLLHRLDVRERLLSGEPNAHVD